MIILFHTYSQNFRKRSVTWSRTVGLQRQTNGIQKGPNIFSVFISPKDGVHRGLSVHFFTEFLPSVMQVGSIIHMTVLAGSGSTNIVKTVVEQVCLIVAE